MKRLASLLVAVSVVGAGALCRPAWAKNKPATDDDTSVNDDDGDAKPAATKKKPKKEKPPADDEDDAKPADEDSKPKSKKGDADADEDFRKQDLTGHDMGTQKKSNEFEKDRFYVDKQDTEKTADQTLIQGSLASTSLLYTESGGPYADNMATPVGSSNSNFNRMFTDLRLQTDFRHIKGGKWDGRVDARLRFVAQPQANSTASAPLPGTLGTTPVRIQSGLTGQNEYEIREMWLVRNSTRSDVFIGRQFIPDLGGVKIDGVRIDYAQSNKFTLVGFGGLFPLRGSRSLTTDYVPDNFVDSGGNRQPVGRFTGAGGFGTAYRTINAYGAFGGVIEAPLGGGEQPRIFATSNGYWRYGTTLDLYHFAIIDLVGSNAAASNFTNVSLGANYKPNPRLRLTASFNRVDSETLSVQAGAFLNSADSSINFIDNETYLQRLSTNQLRGSASAALGQLQRFEVTAALAFKYRPTVVLQSLGGVGTLPITLNAEEGVEAYAGLTDRHSWKDLRVGADVIRTFGVGSIAFQHTDLLGLRLSAAHDIKNGQGEWEAEVSYTTFQDSAVGKACDPTSLDTCFGSSVGALLSLGGSVYYRFNRDWLGLASAYITSQTLQHSNGVTVGTDPAVNGLTGFLRAAYRF